MKMLALFALGILFILCGIEGNPGSMLGSILDPANMVEGAGIQPTASTSIPLSSVLGGVGSNYV